MLAVLDNDIAGAFYLVAVVAFALAAFLVLAARDRRGVALGLVALGLAFVAFVATYDRFSL